MSRILVVDDEELILRMARRGLGRHFEVETANNSDQALRLLAQGMYDLVFSDTHMTRDGEGIELLQRVSELYPSTGRFLASGRLTFHEARAYGFDGFFEKPYDVSKVVAAFEAYLAQRKV